MFRIELLHLVWHPELWCKARRGTKMLRRLKTEIKFTHVLNSPRLSPRSRRPRRHSCFKVYDSWRAVVGRARMCPDESRIEDFEQA